MTELIEKTSWRQRMDEMLDHQKLGDYIPDDESASTLMDYIAKEVELAYKAGMLKFHALDHTMQRATWSSPHGRQLIEDLDFGPESILPSLYLQAKGFKR